MSKILQKGISFSVKRSFNINEVEIFSKLSGDSNPIHLDHKIASKSIFKDRICHGLLISSLFSCLIGNNFPGAIYLNQTLKFKKPVFINEEIIASVEISDIKSIKNKHYLSLITLVKKNDNNIAIEGEAYVLINESL